MNTFSIASAMAALLCAAAPGYGGLTITAPANNTTVAPGQTITVTVDPGTTRYAMVGLIGQDPIGFLPLIAAAPYTFTVKIPAKMPALRRYSLTAVGNLGPSQNDESVPILLDVERADLPVSLKAEISYLETEVAGKTPMVITGTFSDGSSFDVTESSQTTYVSSNPAVATVSADGMVTAVSPGTCKLTVGGMLVVPIVVRPPVRVLPNFAAAYAGWTRQFSAPVANVTNNTAVRWSLTPAGSASGTVSSDGVYTGPRSVAASQYVTITATTVADSTASASATILLSPPITVTVSPATITLQPGQAQAFQAVLTNDVNDVGDTNSGVLWSIKPAGVGTIIVSSPFFFVYQPPATVSTSAAQTLTLEATSITDPTKKASATIHLGH